jgi:glycosyltransferase involved in cell wall biosynthesis
MKIAVIQDHLRGGGTERQSVFLARAFAAAGHTTTLVTFRPGGLLAVGLADSGVSHRALQPFDLGLDWFAPALGATVGEFEADVVLCMGRMANCYAGRLQGALPQTAVVATLRTGKRLPGLFRRSLAAVRHVVANSAFAKTTHAVPNGAGGHCTVIPNALLFPELLDLPPTPATPPIILNVAQFRPGKGQPELIAACAALARDLDWRLEFVGGGSERPHCEHLAAASGVGGRIVFHGWQKSPVEFYRRASIAVLASHPGIESLPNFLVEAQSAGVPVVACDVDGAAECLLDGTTGRLVPAGNTAALTAAIAGLLRDPARRAALSAAARPFARERFERTAIVRSYLELFQRLIGQPR